MAKKSEVSTKNKKTKKTINKSPSYIKAKEAIKRLRKRM
jgi:hypothetical protein